MSLLLFRLALGRTLSRILVLVSLQTRPGLADLHDDVIEFSLAYRELIGFRDISKGSGLAADLARDIVDIVRARCNAANAAVADCLAESINAIDEGTRVIQQMIASVDNVGRHVGAVQEMRIEPPEVTKLTRALAAYPDDFKKHAHTLVDGLTSLSFMATR